MKFERECYMDVDLDENDTPIIPPLADVVKSYAREKDSQPIIELTQDIFDHGNLSDPIDQPENPNHDDPMGVRDGTQDGSLDGLREGHRVNEALLGWPSVGHVHICEGVLRRCRSSVLEGA